jgi:hypothetical protein
LIVKKTNQARAVDVQDSMRHRRLKTGSSRVVRDPAYSILCLLTVEFVFTLFIVYVLLMKYVRGLKILRGHPTIV